MDHVRQIQGIVDEHREQMPTGVVTSVMEQCQFAYEALPNLWKITYAEVDACGKNNAKWELKTAIFEEADAPTPYQNAIPWWTVFRMQKMPRPGHHATLCKPAFSDGPGRVIVVTGFKKWGKRARDQE